MTEMSIEQWLARYHSVVELPEWFESYENLLLREHRHPAQQFFASSGLLRQDEVCWCRVLRWLLDGDACRLAHSFQKALVTHCGLDVPLAAPLRAEREVVDGSGSRLDIVLSTDSWCVVLEAKVNAPESSTQLERYCAFRGRGKFRGGMFLSLVEASEKLPDMWCGIIWADVAELLRAVVEDEGGNESSLQSREDHLWVAVALDFAGFITGVYHNRS
jgi:hypothetical protein